MERGRWRVGGVSSPLSGLFVIYIYKVCSTISSFSLLFLLRLLTWCKEGGSVDAPPPQQQQNSSTRNGNDAKIKVGVS